MEFTEDCGGHGSSGDAGLFGGGVGLIEPLEPLVFVELVFNRDWVGDDDASVGAEEFCFDERGEFFGVVDADIDLGVGFSEIEGGEGVGLVADDEDAQGFEGFAGGFDIEDGFDAAGDDGDGEAEIGRASCRERVSSPV